MSEVIQAIFIRESEVRSTPKPHVVYKVEVHAAVRNWIVWKRYSEFYKLDSQFKTIFPKQATPVRLPPKSYFPSTFSDPEKIEERRRGLEAYLRSILSNRDDRWRLTEVWKEFLCIPVGRSLDGASFYTSESWLDEFTTMSATAREIRSLINKKSTHMARNEISASHNCSVQAKKLLMKLSSRISNLEAGLNGSGMSDGELRRRQDMLTSLKDEKDLLMKLASTDQQQQEYHQPTPVMKEQQIGGGGGRRAFGAAAVQRKKEQLAKETEITRGLDNDGLLIHQQQIMGDQDQQVQQFGSILARQKQLGITIGHELENQNQLLDELDGDVARTQTKLKFANKKLQKIK
ncbi:Phox homologous domain-containing protein [Helicostylum pulchrum]|nr:Phox homologous domain-containing protein [Helicostylum pulchrum]